MENQGKISFSHKDGIAELLISRPKKLNALTAAMAQQLTEYCREINRNNDIRVAIIRGEGEKAFSAGSDIKMLDDLGSNWEGRNRSEYDRDYITPLLHLRKPLIAAIDGYCIGGGLELAICADIRIGVKGSRFGAGEIKLGWHAGSGNVTILPRLIGYSNAARWILTGDLFSAEEAFRVGFLQELVDTVSQMEEQVARLAQSIAKNPPIAVQSAKNLIRLSQGTSVDVGLAWENDMYSYCMLTEDSREGIDAFVNKREPHYKGL